MALPLAARLLGEEPIGQPTTRREQASSTTARQTLPSRGGLGVVGAPWPIEPSQ
jgi:hypothetical protein